MYQVSYYNYSVYKVDILPVGQRTKSTKHAYSRADLVQLPRANDLYIYIVVSGEVI